MNATLISPDGKRVPFQSTDQLVNLITGMSISQHRTHDGEEQFFLRQRKGPNHYRTALVATPVGDGAASVIRLLPTEASNGR